MRILNSIMLAIALFEEYLTKIRYVVMRKKHNHVFYFSDIRENVAEYLNNIPPSINTDWNDELINS